MKLAEVSRLDDDTYCGLIPECQGIITFGPSSVECLENLQATLEGWVLLRLKIGQVLPQVRGVNLNQEPMYEYNYSM